jgi:hypothetical protein
MRRACARALSPRVFFFFAAVAELPAHTQPALWTDLMTPAWRCSMYPEEQFLTWLSSTKAAEIRTRTRTNAVPYDTEASTAG